MRIKIGKKIVTIIIVFAILFNVFTFTMLSYYGKKESKTELQNELRLASEEFTSIIQNYEHSFKLFVEMITEVIDTAQSNEEIETYLKKIDANLSEIEGESFNGIYMLYNDQFFFSWDSDPSVYSIENGYNIKNRPWYINAIQANGDLVWTTPYMSFSFDYMLSTISQLLPDGKTIIAYDIKMSNVDEYNNINTDEDEKIIVCDKNGTIISAYDNNYLGWNLNSTIKEIDNTINSYNKNLIESIDLEKDQKIIHSLTIFKEFQEDFLSSYVYLKDNTNELKNVRLNNKNYLSCLYTTDDYDYIILNSRNLLLSKNLSKWLLPIIAIEIIIIAIFTFLYKYYKDQQIDETTEKLDKTRKLLNVKEQALIAVGNGFIDIYVVNLDDGSSIAVKESIDIAKLLAENEYNFLVASKEFGYTKVQENYREDYLVTTSVSYIKEKLSKGIIPEVEFCKEDGSWMGLKIHKASNYSDTNPLTIWICEAATDRALKLRNQEIMSHITSVLSSVYLVNLKTGKQETIKSNDFFTFRNLSYIQFIEEIENMYLTTQEDICIKELRNIENIINTLSNKDKLVFPYIQVKDGRWFRITAFRDYSFSIDNPVIIITIEDITESQEKEYEILRIEDQVTKLKEKHIVNKKLLEALSAIVEFRNLESGEHIKRIEGYTQILANKVMEKYPEYKLTKELVDTIITSSSLHDIGKIAVPDSILLKPGRLTNEEFEIMKTHSAKGGDIVKMLSGVQDDLTSKYCYEIARHHHERWDGRGYPDGLSGNDIPIAAQIVSIADVYDALVSKRVYKDAYTYDEAFNMIISGECGQFNPQLLGCLALVKSEFELFARGIIIINDEDKIILPEKLDFTGNNILVVDDSEINVEIICGCIAPTGATYYKASNGEEALNIVKESKENFFDLIITDIIMPIMDGHEEAKAIRELDREDTKKVPIIALSAEAYEETIKIYKNNHIDLLLSKPLTTRDLYICLSRYLHKK